MLPTIDVAPPVFSAVPMIFVLPLSPSLTLRIVTSTSNCTHSPPATVKLMAVVTTASDV